MQKISLLENIKKWKCNKKIITIQLPRLIMFSPKWSFRARLIISSKIVPMPHSNCTHLLHEFHFHLPLSLLKICMRLCYTIRLHILQYKIFFRINIQYIQSTIQNKLIVYEIVNILIVAVGGSSPYGIGKYRICLLVYMANAQFIGQGLCELWILHK